MFWENLLQTYKIIDKFVNELMQCVVPQWRNNTGCWVVRYIRKAMTRFISWLFET